MAAWWTSGGTLALSCKFILEKCRLTFKIFFYRFSSIPSWILMSSIKLPMCSFRPTDFYPAVVCEDHFLSFMLKSCICLPALFNEWFIFLFFFCIMLPLRVTWIWNKRRGNGKINQITLKTLILALRELQVSKPFLAFNIPNFVCFLSKIKDLFLSIPVRHFQKMS